MISIKKYIPVVVPLVLGLTVLFSQVVFKSRETKASPVVTQNKLKLHYENNYKEIFYKLDGKKLFLKDRKNKIVIINFWASWCVPCLEEFPSLVKLSNKYNTKDVLIIGINTDDPESYKDSKKVIKKMNIKFPIVFDKESELISKFKVSAIPMSIIFKDKKVIEVSNGAKDFISEEFIEEVDKLLK